ncbi:hypothetical protein H4582DRAFT_2051183 [Lactarius indigo]|nr:hypothetical protein H4582DRAFT_2051183 [Lactarius indigo]
MCTLPLKTLSLVVLGPPTTGGYTNRNTICDVAAWGLCHLHPSSARTASSASACLAMVKRDGSRGRGHGGWKEWHLAAGGVDVVFGVRVISSARQCSGVVASNRCRPEGKHRTSSV